MTTCYILKSKFIPFYGEVLRKTNKFTWATLMNGSLCKVRCVSLYVKKVCSVDKIQLVHFNGLFSTSLAPYSISYSQRNQSMVAIMFKLVVKVYFSCYWCFVFCPDSHVLSVVLENKLELKCCRCLLSQRCDINCKQLSFRMLVCW